MHTTSKRFSRMAASRLGILAAAAGLVLSGCMVGPDYHAPKTAVPADWVNPTLSSAGATTAPSTRPTTHAATAEYVAPRTTTQRPIEQVEWWKSFKDPLLNSLIERAVDANLDLKQAEARLYAARATRGVIGAALLPDVNLDASYTHAGFGHGNVHTLPAGPGTTVTHNDPYRTSLFRHGFDASWELDLFGGVRRNIESADANIQAAVEDRRDVMVTVIAEVASSYIALRGFQRQINISEENLQAQQQTANVTREKFGAGFVSRLDLANAEATVYATQSNIPALQISERQTIYALSILLGDPPGALIAELTTAKPIPITPPDVPIGLPAELLRRRPDIRRAEAQLHSAVAQIGVATAQLYPQISLLGSLDISAATAGGLANWYNHSWSIGPTLSWPIFAGGKLVAGIDVQNAVERQAYLTYRQSVLTAMQDVENALVAYAREQQRRDALSQSVAAYRQALDLSLRLYRQGQTDFLNVLEAERSLYGVEISLAQSQTNIASDLTALYKALGGGWQIEEASHPTTQPAEIEELD